MEDPHYGWFIRDNPIKMDIEHHRNKYFLDICIPNWVMFNWNIYQPLYIMRFAIIGYSFRNNGTVMG